jgi:hypothetical protein
VKAVLDARNTRSIVGRVNAYVHTPKTRWLVRAMFGCFVDCVNDMQVIVAEIKTKGDK